MKTAVVALGGNIGDPMQTLEAALDRIKKLGTGLKVSKFYKTKPISSIKQPKFINAVCLFRTELTPNLLMLELESIEKDLGKTKKPKDAPRPIDLDLLFYGNTRSQEGGLSIPHPRWKERLFVLVPLFDLIEEVEVEDEVWSVKQLIEDFPKEEVQEVYNEECSY